MSQLKIYQSSAGSGKTYTLVKEYLLIVLKKPSMLRSTLAVTFTNDATGEMKERVVKSLWELSSGKNETLKTDLLNSLGNSFDIKNASVRVLNHILHHYTELSIQTIDSFFLNITRSLAYETGLPGRYNIELNRDAAIDFITSELLLTAGENEEITKWLIDFAYFRMDKEKGWDMGNEIKESCKYLFDDEIKKQLESLLVDTNLIKHLKDQVREFKRNLKNLSEEVLQIIESAGVSSEDVLYKSKGFTSALNILGKDKLTAGFEFNSYFRKAAEEGKLFGQDAAGYLISDIKLQKEIQKKLKEIYDFFNKGNIDFSTSELILKNIYLKALLVHLNEQLSRYRRENQVMLLSDVGSVLQNFISGDDTPFIYEKAGNAYRNFLIDEFQDTSVTQWKNMLPLLINSLAQNNQVLTVGDVKQSIYRWRGGDMNLLMERVKSELGHHAQKTEVLNLNTNYRSTEAVIQFNNTLFGTAAKIFSEQGEKNELIEKAFEKEQVEQKIIKNHVKGYVQIELIKKETEIQDIKYPDNCKDSIKKILGRTLQYINEQKEKGYGYGDIALLVRDNKSGSLLADFLVLNGISQINSRDSLLISKAPQIRFLISVFRYLNDTTDQVSEKHILWYACKILGFSNEDVNSRIFKSSKRFLQMTLTEAGSAIIKLFGLNTTPDGYIQRFEDLLLEKSSIGIGDIQLFMKWWESEKERLKISVQQAADMNSITIMTIHNSKGLQFPVVIMPFTAFELAKSKGQIWISSDVEPYSEFGLVPLSFNGKLEASHFQNDYHNERRQKHLDEINTLYVACTRAEDKLFLFVEPKEKPKLTKAGDLILFSLQEEGALKTLMTAQKDDLFVLGEDALKHSTKKTKEDVPDRAEVIPLNNYLINERGAHKGFKIRKKVADDDHRNFGIRLHDLMAIYYSANDRRQIIDQIDAAPIDDKIKYLLRRDTEKAMEMIESRKWITGEYKILNESEICDSEGNILRPDRMMIKDKMAVVLDYKTGQPLNEHAQQIMNYKNVLKGTGFTSVETYLCYPETGEMISVS